MVTGKAPRGKASERFLTRILPDGQIFWPSILNCILTKYCYILYYYAKELLKIFPQLQEMVDPFQGSNGTYDLADRISNYGKI